MPRLVAVATSHDPRNDPTLDALRRTLWQLAIAGCAIALALALRVPGTGNIALWCALLPLVALATWYRDALRAVLRLRRTRPQVAGVRMPRAAQARRARLTGDRRATRGRPQRGAAAPRALKR